MTELHVLAQAVAHPSPARKMVAKWHLLAALALAPLAFSAQIIVSYVVASSLCPAGGRPQVFLLLMNAAAIALAFVGFSFAVSSWIATRREKPGGVHRTVDVGEGRSRFLAMCGLWVSTIFLLAVVLDLTAIFAFGTCAGIPAHNSAPLS